MEDKTTKRRSFLKRAAIVTLIGGLVGGIGVTAWAHSEHGRHGEAFAPERIESMVKHLAVDANATPEQSARLTEIAKSAAVELAPMREKAKEARKRAMAILGSPTVDRAALERLRAEQLEAMDAGSRRLTKAIADAAEVLTPEQRKQLAGRFRWFTPAV